MDTRTAEILEAVVREFIETGEPVSSGWLYDNYDFGIRPAMIRFEMNGLTEHGYLEQPHHAAGRVPTNRGYEFFANHALQSTPNERKVDREALDLLERKAWQELSEKLSETLGLLSVAADMTRHEVYKEGLQNLIENLEWQDRSELQEVIRDFEELDSRLTTMDANSEENPIKVFIGKKSPVTRSQCLAVFAGDYDVDGTRVVLYAIGPTRMDYEKTARIFKQLKRHE